MRAADPSLSGVRTEDVKACIVEQMTGRKVSGKTIRREEAMAEKVADLVPEWREAADAGALSAKAVDALADADEATQRKAFERWSAAPLSKQATTELVASMTAAKPAPDKRLAAAERALAGFAARPPKSITAADAEAISRIAELARQARDAASGSLKRPAGAAGPVKDES